MNGNPFQNHKTSLRIAYIGPFTFPGSDAGSQRVLGIASTLRYMGHDIVIGAGGRIDVADQSLIAKKSPFSITALPEQAKKSANRLEKLLRVFTWGKSTLDWLRRLTPQPDAVLLYGGGSAYVRQILPWCERNDVPMMVDVVEWYEPSHVPGGWFGPFHWDSELSLRFYYPRVGNIIAISTFLEQYYRHRGSQTLRMPPTLDVENLSARLSTSDGPLTLAYAGFPGKKDLIGNIVDAVLAVDPKGTHVRLIIAGPTPEDIIRLPQLESYGLLSLPASIKAIGLLSHAQVLDLVKSADFVPLLRSPLRYAQAGFPTKIPESLALGTPVICNITSDLAEYIHDGVEGIICSDHSVSAFAEALDRALSMTTQQRSEMRKAARTQAEQAFDYRLYAEPLSNFLGQVL